MNPKPIEPAPEWAVKLAGKIVERHHFEYPLAQQAFIARIIADHTPKETGEPICAVASQTTTRPCSNFSEGEHGQPLPPTDAAMELIMQISAQIKLHFDAAVACGELSADIDLTYITELAESVARTHLPSLIARHTAGLRARVEDLQLSLLKVIEEGNTERDSLREEIINSRATAQHMDLARLEAGCPDDDTLVMHCRELRAALNASEERVKELEQTELAFSAHFAQFRRKDKNLICDPAFAANEIITLRSDLTAARAKIAALEQDRARLDWLDLNATEIILGKEKSIPSARLAIDAAMRATGEQKS